MVNRTAEQRRKSKLNKQLVNNRTQTIDNKIKKASVDLKEENLKQGKTKIEKSNEVFIISSLKHCTVNNDGLAKLQKENDSLNFNLSHKQVNDLCIANSDTPLNKPNQVEFLQRESNNQLAMKFLKHVVPRFVKTIRADKNLSKNQKADKFNKLKIAPNIKHKLVEFLIKNNVRYNSLVTFTNVCNKDDDLRSPHYDKPQTNNHQFTDKSKYHKMMEDYSDTKLKPDLNEFLTRNVNHPITMLGLQILKPYQFSAIHQNQSLSMQEKMDKFNQLKINPDTKYQLFEYLIQQGIRFNIVLPPVPTVFSANQYNIVNQQQVGYSNMPMVDQSMVQPIMNPTVMQPVVNSAVAQSGVNLPMAQPVQYTQPIKQNLPQYTAPNHPPNCLPKSYNQWENLNTKQTSKYKNTNDQYKLKHGDNYYQESVTKAYNDSNPYDDSQKYMIYDHDQQKHRYSDNC